MLRTGICDLFGIEHPIVLAGMGGVALADLVAVVSDAGGLGVIGGATLDAEALRREIRRTRELTDRPFAVDLLAPIPEMIRPQIQVVFDEGVRIFVAGLAVPREFIAEMHARGMLVVVMVGKVRHALAAEAVGADVVAAQGTEAGGHTGEIGTLALVNPYAEGWEQRADEIKRYPLQAMVSLQEGVMDYMGLGGDADPERTFMPAGQGCGTIREIKPAAEVVRDLVREAEVTLRRLATQTAGVVSAAAESA